MRSPFATSVKGTSERGSPRATAAALTVAALTLAVVGLIVLHPGTEAVLDQTFVSYGFAQGYPHFEEGIVSYLLASRRRRWRCRLC